jgi:hypothetical protein
MASVSRYGLKIINCYVTSERDVVAFPDTHNNPKPQSDATAKALVECIPYDGVEHAAVVAYDAHVKPLAWEIVATGGVDMVPFHPREIYRWALTVPFCRYVGVAHNHPSGDVTPSLPDKRATAIAAGVGKAIGLDMLYSIVVTHESGEWADIPLGERRQPTPPGEPNPMPEGDPEEEYPEPEESESESDPEPEETPEEIKPGEREHGHGTPPKGGPADLEELKRTVGRILKVRRVRSNE